MWQCVSHLTEWECSLAVKSLVPQQADITSLKSNLPGQSRIFSGIFSVSCIRTMYAELFINVDVYIWAPSPKIFTALLTAVILCKNFSTKHIKKTALILGFIMHELNIYTGWWTHSWMGIYFPPSLSPNMILGFPTWINLLGLTLSQLSLSTTGISKFQSIVSSLVNVPMQCLEGTRDAQCSVISRSTYYSLQIPWS